ncbi:hypothetical protein K474DRAFT_624355 [Panus rudis PR-1116 ss-1]|nr:hypothetical protein K474DRAFT_624355 [Panus rudis PR-1116 ss-1]
MSSAAPLIAIPQLTSFSGRARTALAELNRVAADPKLGASLEDIRSRIRERVRKPTAEPNPRDLVELLIRDNDDIWQRLLKNQFCQNMKTAPASDKTVLARFNRYMVQDFIYCARLVTYETDRANKATTAAQYNISAERIGKDASYANSMLITCITPSPDGLGISPDTAVLQAKIADVLESYTDYQISTANNRGWVESLVVMIPCIQSYYQIAHDLKANSTDKDSLWYKLWAVVNDDESYPTNQRDFFIANYDAWKDIKYQELTEIFRRACQGEIDLWNYALNAAETE